jgi:hypothetical protein
LDFSPLVYCAAFDLHPSMSFEGKLLRSQNQASGHAAAAEQTSGHNRALQAKHMLRVPDHGKIYSVTNLLCNIACEHLGADFPVTYGMMHSSKVPMYKEVERGKADQRFPKEKSHELVRLL